MNASERNLLDESDRMTESMLVRLEDWQLAYLRVAMLHEIEETLNASIAATGSESETPNNTEIPTSSRQEAGITSSASSILRHMTKPRLSGRGYGTSEVSNNASCELLEAAR